VVFIGFTQSDFCFGQYRYDYNTSNTRANHSCSIELYALDASGYLLLVALFPIGLQR
jgi:hypothetical protein